MLLGLVLTALIALTIAGLSAATASAWRAQADDARAVPGNERVTAYLQRLLRGAKDVLYVSEPSVGGVAVVVVWDSDDFAGGDVEAGDGLPELGELSLLYFDPQTGSLDVCAPPRSTELASAGTVWQAEYYTSAADDAFDAAPAFSIFAGFERHPILGGPGSAVRVTAARFVLDSGGLAPLVTYELTADDNEGGGTSLIEGAATVRSAAGVDVAATADAATADAASSPATSDEAAKKRKRGPRGPKKGGEGESKGSGEKD